MRSSAWAQTAPNMPALEPITATGLLRNAFVASGREAQSSAFLSAPGIEELYSGVAIRTASAEATAARSAATAGGRRLDVVVLVVRRHLAQPVPELERVDAARAAPPRPAATRCCASRGGGCRRWRGSASLRRLHQREVGLQGDLVGEGLGAVRHVGVPVDPERGAVDRGLELEPVALVAVRVGRRADDRAGERGGLGDALDRDLALELDAGRRRPDASSVEKETTRDGAPRRRTPATSGGACRFSSFVSRLAIRADAGEAAVLERGLEVRDGAAERRRCPCTRPRRRPTNGRGRRCTCRSGIVRLLLCDAHVHILQVSLSTQLYI